MDECAQLLVLLPQEEGRGFESFLYLRGFSGFLPLVQKHAFEVNLKV